jgi:adenosylcobyric acid synthase
VRGYEIHAGVSTGPALAMPALVRNSVLSPRERIESDGAISADNQIIATYLHGLFDAPTACNALLAWAGLATGEGAAIDIAARREAEFDRLADMVSEHLDTTLIAQLCGGAP